MGALGSKLAPAAERTPLFGRGREIARLLSSLERGERLVTVTGPSGMGKTRLALRVASDASSLFDEVRIARLASSKSVADIQGVVAEALGIVQRQGLDLATSIASRGRVLLVADNLEHLLPEALPLLDAWLDHCPQLQILASSIVPLGIEGEVRFELGPLAVDDAIALYLDRAQRAAADRQFSHREFDVLRELVQRLDGLPLAIELAAARVRVLSPVQLLSRIDERFSLLHDRRRGRHGSLWDALSLSWELLSESERRALAYASVFERGFDLEAAEAILGSEGEGTRVLEVLDSLRAKALVQFGDEDEPRFSLYESVRAFAARQLESMGEEEEALLRHARYFVEWAEQESHRCHGPEAPTAIRRLLAERENLLAVQRRLAAREPRLACRAGDALAEILALNGPPSLEEEVLSASIECARRAEDEALLCRAKWRRARAYKRLGRHDEARRDIEAGLTLARARSWPAMEGRLLLESGAIDSITGRYEESLVALSAVREIGEREGIREFEGIAWLVQGVAEENRGQSEASYEAFQRALVILREVGQLRYQGVVHLNIGAMASHLGRFDEAKRNLEEARRIFRLLENPGAETSVLLNLGGVALADGELGSARRWLESALGLERQVGNPRFRGLAMAGLAILSLESGSPRQAATQFEEAFDVLQPLGEWRHIASHEPFYALSLAKVGRFEEARKSVERARQAFEGVDDQASLGPLALLEDLLHLEEAEALGDGEARRQVLRRLVRGVDEPIESPSIEASFIARRLVRKALERLGPAARSLRVGPEAAWFEWEGKRVDMQRRTAVRHMLRALVEKRISAPGEGLSAEALVKIGWPGERILPEAAAMRVYSGIRTLRSLGLEGVLLRHADGYLLDPEIAIDPE